jgi:formate dehydrogenase subunit gamma
MIPSPSAIGALRESLRYWLMSKKRTLIELRPPRHEAASRVAARYDNQPDALLEILHDLQHEAGYVEEAALPVLAKALNISRAEVHGVVSFYHDFRAKPAGRHVVKVCKAEACQSMAGNELAAAAEKSLKIKFGETTSDGAITLEAVYCLGLCATAPAMLVDERPVGRVTPEKFRALAAELSS